MHSVRIPDKLWEALKQLARREERSANYLVNRILSEALSVKAEMSDASRLTGRFKAKADWLPRKEGDIGFEPGAGVPSPLRPKPALPGSVAPAEPIAKPPWNDAEYAAIAKQYGTGSAETMHYQMSHAWREG